AGPPARSGAPRRRGRTWWWRRRSQASPLLIDPRPPRGEAGPVVVSKQCGPASAAAGRTCRLTLRREITLFIVLPLAALVLLLHGVFSAIVLRDFARIEDAAVEDDVKRVRDAIEQTTGWLVDKSKDWAWWDDVWHYVQEPNDAFVASNLNA